MSFVKLSNDGVEQAVDPKPLLKRYGGRFWTITNRVININEGPARDAQLAELWSVIQKDSPDVSPSEAGRFYAENSYIDPVRWPENPINRRLLAEVQPETSIRAP